jgi:hypothetical protein
MTVEEKNNELRKYGLGKGASLKDSFYTREKHYYYFHYFRKTVIDCQKGIFDPGKALVLLDYLKDVYEIDYQDEDQGLAPHSQFIYEYEQAKQDIIKQRK